MSVCAGGEREGDRGRERERGQSKWAASWAGVGELAFTLGEKAVTWPNTRPFISNRRHRNQKKKPK